MFEKRRLHFLKKCLSDMLVDNICQGVHKYRTVTFPISLLDVQSVTVASSIICFDSYLVTIF